MPLCCIVPLVFYALHIRLGLILPPPDRGRHRFKKRRGALIPIKMGVNKWLIISILGFAITR
jgi:hypothetical protein